MAGEHGARASLIAVFTLALLLVAFAGVAAAEPPVLTISQPVAGYVLSSNPPVEGTTSDTVDPVTVRIYAGSDTDGSIAWTSPLEFPASGTWAATTPSLPDGEYTAVAEQTNEASEKGASQPVTFKIDTHAPTVSLASPANGAFEPARPKFAGNAGTARGDSATVTVSIYEGGSISGSPKREQTATVEAGKWNAEGLPLPNGIYTAQAEQTDAAGHRGLSQPKTFYIKVESPTVTLETSPLTTRGGTFMTDATPRFSGSGGVGSEDSKSITVWIYKGEVVVGMLTAPLSGSAWATGPASPLPDGTYSAQAEQENANPGKAGFSHLSTFTVDADAPQVTISYPNDGSSTTGSSQTLSGSAGSAEGDSGSVTVDLFAGAAIAGQAPIEAVTVQASSGAWTAAFGGLNPGAYTARAEQRDDVGNVGYTSPVRFTVTQLRPVASFQWFPSAPTVGEPVSLVSTSTDGAGPITKFAWSLTPVGAFTPGGHVLSTSFATAGVHTVRLMVTDANGLSGEVAEQIAVGPRVLRLMQPFPVVRIAGSSSSSSARITLFTVLAPVGASVRVTCHGGGCPSRAHAFVLAARRRGGGGTVLIYFTRFQRTLRAGAVLEIRVSKPGEIGKYTRFKVRRGRLPARLDSCIGPAGTTPISCPSS